ncbi:MAG: tRNA (adenosine(37)-N6)-threonylcarbamoyltransferase complex transferase subunit TsaD [Saprospiraceae bacterium]|nr:tRNA (adenosine(37)-N6)-threonylcarbamoyltransferase complex transferase subunit TsaD [Saprospiraceae bacterium]MBK7525213.1 tRNA (adenosine(37)-N6)-threonylcarbamoyltransferase complex transferase subunit TsaD [Saprospiraceae bacterium]MBK9044221.1 tRNA (adenosine(37)-N6)-threonylcarbamoyltransferase complex transferase subunit TsaD [Saprospiraceae bacterium]
MFTNKIVILAIESSCDDTGASIIIDGKVKSNCIATQTIHDQYGGVIPEVASRQHQQNIVPVVDKAITEAGITLQDISAIAFTRGPGLLGSLLVGVSFAKALAMSLDIPLIEVHHMQAHILAHFAMDKKPEFPFLCLTVSGGHTQIVLVRDYLDMEILGQTIDDAAGEAFDKAGKLLGLPYPAGPHIDKLARNGKPVYSFPIPNIPELNFSFSGFKTSVLYFLEKNVQNNPNFIKENLENLCSSIQNTIIVILLKKLELAIKLHKVDTIAMAGGVSANSGLREALLQFGRTNHKKIFIPAFEYCTDNAAMIGITGYYKYLKGDFAELSVSPDPRMKM